MYRILILVFLGLGACRAQEESKLKGNCFGKIQDSLIQYIDDHPSFDFTKLPDDVLVRILSFLEPRELVQLLSVSKSLAIPAEKSLARLTKTLMPEDEILALRNSFPGISEDNFNVYLGGAYLLYLKSLLDPSMAIVPKKIMNHTDEIYNLTKLDNGLIASASLDQTIKIWDPKGVRQTTRLSENFSQEQRLIPLNDQKLVTYGVANTDGIMKVWDANTGDLVRTLGQENEASGVRAMIQLHDGKLLSAHFNGTIRIWNLADISDFKESTTLLFNRGKIAKPFDRKMVQLEDGLIAFPSREDVIKIVDPDNFEVLKTLPYQSPIMGSEVRTLMTLRNGSIGVVRQSHRMEIWDWKSEKIIKELFLGEENRVIELADGKIAFFTKQNNSKLLRTWDPATDQFQNLGQGFKQHPYDLIEIPDRRLMSVNTVDGETKIWDTDRATFLKEIQENHQKKFSTILIDNDQWFFAQSKDLDLPVEINHVDLWREIRRILAEYGNQ